MVQMSYLTYSGPLDRFARKIGTSCSAGARDLFKICEIVNIDVKEAINKFLGKLDVNWGYCFLAKLRVLDTHATQIRVHARHSTEIDSNRPSLFCSNNTNTA